MPPRPMLPRPHRARRRNSDLDAPLRRLVGRAGFYGVFSDEGEYFCRGILRPLNGEDARCLSHQISGDQGRRVGGGVRWYINAHLDTGADVGIE